MSQSTIANRQYTTQVATLPQATGSVVGDSQNGSADQKWVVAVVGGNQITLKNVGTGTYASGIPFEGQGAPVVGNSSTYTWQQLSVAGGWYQIATTDGGWVWRLTSGSNGAAISLQATPYTENDAQWGYNPAT